MDINKIEIVISFEDVKKLRTSKILALFIMTWFVLLCRIIGLLWFGLIAIGKWSWTIMDSIFGDKKDGKSKNNSKRTSKKSK